MTTRFSRLAATVAVLVSVANPSLAAIFNEIHGPVDSQTVVGIVAGDTHISAPFSSVQIDTANGPVHFHLTLPEGGALEWRRLSDDLIQKTIGLLQQRQERWAAEQLAQLRRELLGAPPVEELRRIKLKLDALVSSGPVSYQGEARVLLDQVVTAARAVPPASEAPGLLAQLRARGTLLWESSDGLRARLARAPADAVEEIEEGRADAILERVFEIAERAP